MTRSRNVLGLLLLTLAGVWGCARVPGGSPDAAAGARAAQAEARAQRLEEDFRAVASARDAARKGLAAAAAERDEARQKLTEATAAADDLRRKGEAAEAALAGRTAERDAVQTQFDAFRRSLRDMLGQAEAAAAPAPAPRTVTVSDRN